MLRGMLKDPTNLSKELATSKDNLTDAAKAAIELDRVIAKLEGRAPEEQVVEEQLSLPPPPPVDASSLVSTISDDAFDKPTVSSSHAKTVEDIMSAIAYEIHNLAKSISKEGDLIAEGTSLVRPLHILSFSPSLLSPRPPRSLRP